MKCPPEYWIWLQRALGPGKRLNGILSYFGDPVTLYEAGHKNRLASDVLTKKDADALAEYSPSQSYNVMKQCTDNGWSIVTFDDDRYPPLLRETDDYPAVLYVWGDTSVLTAKVCIGMVGTRRASDYGLHVAESLALSLASAGAVIVSGGAIGVDKASHRGAVRAGGKTVAILGNGLGHPYLAENEKMRRVIAQNGAVVSEYFPFSPPSRHTFPVRNRLISGMSLGTVVIEAGEKSGSLITARLALEQGRDVFAVPGNVMSTDYLGTNSLIRDGARAVFSAMDVLDGYLEQYGEYLNPQAGYEPLKPMGNYGSYLSAVRKKSPENSKTVNKEYEKRNHEKQEESIMQGQRELPSYATESAKTVFLVLGNDPMPVDELVQATGLPVQDVLSALTELEMYSLAQMHSGKRYTLKNL